MRITKLTPGGRIPDSRASSTWRVTVVTYCQATPTKKFQYVMSPEPPDEAAQL